MYGNYPIKGILNVCVILVRRKSYEESGVLTSKEILDNAHEMTLYPLGRELEPGTKSEQGVEQTRSAGSGKLTKNTKMLFVIDGGRGWSTSCKGPLRGRRTSRKWKLRNLSSCLDSYHER